MRDRAKRTSRTRQRPTPPTEPIALSIERLGAQGDGVATLQGAPVYVAGALPGEQIHARLRQALGDGWRADLASVERASADRVDPPCPHFGACGGCALQHLAPDAYRAWKREKVAAALHQRGFTAPPVAEIVATAPRRRRRVTLTAYVRRGRAAIGFHRRRSHEPIDIETCDVLAPVLVDLIHAMRQALPGLLENGGAFTVQALQTDTGVDLLLDADRGPTLAEREAFAAFAEAQDLARLSWRADGELEPIAWRRPALVRFGAVDVAPPPGAFLQASQEGETAIVDAMRNAFDSMQNVADLFSGCGSLSFPLSDRARVHAVDAAPDLIDALITAAHRAECAQVTAERRDLFAHPLEPAELAAYDTVVFDPPRAGARAQAERLAASAVPLVIAVSCEPATFARDARILVDGGYELDAVTPVDQFLWSASVELVAIFRRAAPQTPSRRPRR